MGRGEDEERERLLRVALWMIRGISGRGIARAIEARGSLERACALPRERLAEVMELRPGARRQLCVAPADLAGWAASWLDRIRAREGRAILRGEGGYPGFGALVDPPEVLFCRGRLAAAGSERAVAVVGTRKADLLAVRQARRMGAALAQAGYTVVSGGALGVDRAAHEGALEAGGATVAVLGSGVLLPLPASNRRLFARILAEGGGLASELPPAAPARPEHFPRRNRLVAGLARALVVVRAAAGSGSLYTAAYTRALGRLVLVVPAPEAGAAAAGGQALLEEGALPIRDEGELLEVLEGSSPTAGAGDASLEERILAALALIPASIAEVAARLSLDPEEAAERITSLCVQGVVRPAGPGRFLRVGG